MRMRYDHRGLTASGGRALLLALFLTICSLVDVAAQEPRSRVSPLLEVWASPYFGILFEDVALPTYADNPLCGVLTGNGNLLMPRVGAHLHPLSQIVITPFVSLTRTSTRLTQNRIYRSRLGDGTFDTVRTQMLYSQARSTFGGGVLVGVSFDPLRLVGGVGYDAEISMTSSQEEQILSPLGATFNSSGTHVRPVDRRGSVDLASGIFSMEFQMSLSLPISDRWRLTPAIGYRRDLTEVATGREWRRSSVHGGLALEFQVIRRIVSPPTLAAIPDPPETPPPPPQLEEPSRLTIQMDAVGVGPDGEEYADPVIEIFEAPFTQTVPLLDHIFFSRNSAEIPSRYQRIGRSREFDTDSLLNTTPTSIHRQMLNVIARRMIQRPEVTVRLVGSTSREERDRENLALARASAVKEYLVYRGVAPERIAITAGEPANPASELTEGGRQENRRVAFVFDGASLLYPITIERFARVASPPAIRFRPRISADTTIASLNVRVTQGEKILLELTQGMPEADRPRIWELEDLRINRDMTPITFQADVTDVLGNQAVDEGEFRVQERVRTLSTAGDFQGIAELTLVGFAFDSARLQPFHRGQLHEFIRGAPEGSRIEITGYTDRLGDQRRNRELARSRAERVAEEVREIRRDLGMPEMDVAVIESSSPGNSPWDNELPEGREFSRMVRLLLLTPSIP